MALNPDECNARVALRDGRTLSIRAIRPSDRETLRAEFHKLRPASVRTRFFAAKHELSARELDFFTQVDFAHHVALVAELHDGVGPRPVGSFVRPREPGHAEIAITVVDELHGHGIGTALLQQLARLARALAIGYLDAYVLEENQEMIDVLRHSGMPMRTASEGGRRSSPLTWPLPVVMRKRNCRGRFAATTPDAPPARDAWSCPA